jgi:hypothetical protein
MENHHGKPQDSMQSDGEGEEVTAPGLGLSASGRASVGLPPQGQKVGANEAAGTATDIAAKMANLGKSTGSTLKSSNNVFN